MLGAVYIFGVLFLAFGVVPHQWIDHADKDLGWNGDKIIFGPCGILKPESAGGWFPITMQYEAMRDTIVVLIHVVVLRSLHLPRSWWQKRGDASRTRSPRPRYGRPLVRKG